MKQAHKIITAILAVILGTLAMAAQPKSNVTWTTSVDVDSRGEGAVTWTARFEPGWHIYGLTMPEIKDMPTYPTRFTVQPADGVTLVGEVETSRPAETHFDPVMSLELPMWEGEPVTFTQKIRLASPELSTELSGSIEYMACSNKACTPPATENFSLQIGDPSKIETPVSEDKRETATVTHQAPSAEEADWWAPVEPDTNTASASGTSSWWMIFAIGFLGGLLALLTPCVWPMIPMTVSFFLKTSKQRSKAITNAVIYGLSIVVIFLILGIGITLCFGAGKLNEIATSAVFNIIFFLLLVVFAISFFGAFEIKLPSRWANAMDNKAETTSGLVSIFFMAFTLVLVSFSCTGPIIGTLLVEAASQGAIIGPAVGMGGFALGLALPFALFAIFPSFLQAMPKSGGWLNSVKVVLGFIELILSLKFLSVADLAYGWRILDREVFVAIWIVLFILLGMYLLGKLRFAHDDKKDHTSVSGLFLGVASLSFAVYLLPGLWGAPLKSISAFAPPLTTQDFNLYGGVHQEFDDYDQGMTYAREHGKPVMLDFTGYGCVNCRKMEMAVFDTPDVRSILDNDYVVIKLHVDDKTALASPYKVEEYGKATEIRTVGDKWSYLQRHKLGINQQPYYMLLDNEGKPLASSRDYDENVAAFVKWLNDGKTEYNK